MRSAHFLSGLCTMSSFPLRRAWCRLASQPKARMANVFLSSSSTHLAWAVSADCPQLCQSPWGGLILNTRMTFPHAESPWHCHMERRRVRQIVWCRFVWTRLVYVSAALIVSHFHAVLTAVRGVPIGWAALLLPILVLSWGKQTAHRGEDTLHAKESQLSPRKKLITSGEIFHQLFFNISQILILMSLSNGHFML